VHGHLNMMYQELRQWEEANKGRIDIVLCCGDFQAMRTKIDLNDMACPDKYLKMGDFWEYFEKKKKAPYLTLVVGGNHESSKFLSDL
jgi:lariat debranching enzyme